MTPARRAFLLCLLTRPAAAAESAAPWTGSGPWSGPGSEPVRPRRQGLPDPPPAHLGGHPLVEEFGDPAKQPTQTVFHRDGERILTTHDCAQGNQPRLSLRAASSPDVLLFDFLDATNLRSAADSHLVRLTLHRRDANHLVREEVYATGGREEIGTLVLERVR